MGVTWRCPTCGIAFNSSFVRGLSGPRCPCLAYKGVPMELVSYDTVDCGSFKLVVVESWE